MIANIKFGFLGILIIILSTLFLKPIQIDTPTKLALAHKRPTQNPQTPKVITNQNIISSPKSNYDSIPSKNSNTLIKDSHPTNFPNNPIVSHNHNTSLDNQNQNQNQNQNENNSLPTIDTLNQQEIINVNEEKEKLNNKLEIIKANLLFEKQKLQIENNYIMEKQKLILQRQENKKKHKLILKDKIRKLIYNLLAQQKLSYQSSSDQQLKNRLDRLDQKIQNISLKNELRDIRIQKNKIHKNYLSPQSFSHSPSNLLHPNNHSQPLDNKLEKLIENINNECYDEIFDDSLKPQNPLPQPKLSYHNPNLSTNELEIEYTDLLCNQTPDNTYDYPNQFQKYSNISNTTNHQSLTPSHSPSIVGRLCANANEVGDSTNDQLHLNDLSPPEPLTPPSKDTRSVPICQRQKRPTQIGHKPYHNIINTKSTSENNKESEQNNQENQLTWDDVRTMYFNH